MSLSNGLIAWYKLDGDFNDSSGFNRHATAKVAGASAGITFKEDIFGTVACFDGVSDTVGAYMETPFKLQEDISTVSLWINKKTIASTHNHHIASSGGSNDFLVAVDSTRKPYMYSLAVTSISTTAITNDTWYHMTYVMEKASSTTAWFRIYLNGVQIHSELKAALPNSTTHSTNLAFGTDWDSAVPTGFFAGCMRDIRVYNRALTQEEIKILSGFNGTDAYTPSVSIKSNSSNEFDYNMCVNNMSYTNDTLLYGHGRYHNFCPLVTSSMVIENVDDIGLFDIEDDSLKSFRALILGAGQGLVSAVSCAFEITNLISNKAYTLSYKSKFLYNQRGYIIEVIDNDTTVTSKTVDIDTNNHKRYYEDSSLMFTPTGNKVKIKITVKADAGGSVFRIAFGDFQLNLGNEILEYSPYNITGAPVVYEQLVAGKNQQLIYPFPYKLDKTNFSIYGWFRPTFNSGTVHTQGYYHCLLTLRNTTDDAKNIMLMYYGSTNKFELAVGNNSVITGTTLLINPFTFTADDTIFYCCNIQNNKLVLSIGKLGGSLITSEAALSNIDFTSIEYLYVGISYLKDRQSNVYHSHIHLLSREVNGDEAEYLFKSKHKPQVEKDTVLYLDFEGNAKELKHRKLLYNGYSDIDFNRYSGSVIPSKGAINYSFEVINKSVGTLEYKNNQFEKGTIQTAYTDRARIKPSLIYPINIINQAQGTISFWFYMNQETSTGNPIFTNGGTEANHAFDLILQRDAVFPNGIFYYRKYSAADVSVQAIASAPIDVYKNWNHIACTWINGGAGKLYFNGQLIATTSGNMNMATMGEFFAIGSHFRNPMSFKIDELRIDDIERTQAELLAWYNTQYPFYPRGEEYIIL